jgi:hypothetical protein
MEPGTELDAEIARKIFKMVIMVDSETGEFTVRDNQTKKWVPIPKYSQNTDVAYLIINHFSYKGFFAVVNSVFTGVTTEWSVTFHSNDGKITLQSNGKTVAQAICIAALGLHELIK